MNKKERVIRVFLSSSFLDMQAVRDHLNRHVFPRLRKKCAQRGVSFYAIDLRWGVTKEEATSNRTVDICLKQVKESIPYFIGLIGNRYGWIPEQESLVEKYPWIGEHKPISATEMEIRYYLREAKDEKTNSFFAVKDSEFCDPAFDDGRHDELSQLIALVSRETGRAPFVYSTIEALGQAVSHNILALLDARFPESECTLAHETDRYIRQIEEYDKSEALQEMERENFERRGKPLCLCPA